jgi:hypothetical protein
MHNAPGVLAPLSVKRLKRVLPFLTSHRSNVSSPQGPYALNYTTSHIQEASIVSLAS